MRYYHSTLVYHKWQSYDTWFQRYIAQQTEFVFILDYFLPFCPHNNLENNFFYKYHKWKSFKNLYHNENHWDTEPDSQFFFLILDHFLLFCLNNDPKKFEKMKKIPGDTIILHKCTKNNDHIELLFCSWDMARDGCNFYFSFCAIFCRFTAITTQRIKITKKFKQTSRDIIISQLCTKNYRHMMDGSWCMVQYGWTERQIDGRTDR